MSSTKEYRDYILEQLNLVLDVSCWPMMGEFLLYADGALFGGIYDDRLLVKKVPGFNDIFEMSEVLPYEKGKPMYLVDSSVRRLSQSPSSALMNRPVILPLFT